MKYDPAVDIWAPLSIPTIASLFAGASGLRWWLSGGYAIEHRVGRPTRSHGDIDISVLGSDWRALLALLPPHLEPTAAMDGYLLPLREHADDPALQNIFVRDHRTNRWVLQVNLEPGDEEAWHYRRDTRVTAPWPLAVTFVDPLPTGSLATQLLFKSRHQLPKDDADLAVAYPMLTASERRWLHDAVTLVHPDSPWLTSGALT